jgi:hypothetical protein
MFEDIKPFLPSAQMIVMILAGLTILAYILFYFAGRQYNRSDGFKVQQHIINKNY